MRRTQIQHFAGPRIYEWPLVGNRFRVPAKESQWAE
jgi:hypothetical protein